MGVELAKTYINHSDMHSGRLLKPSFFYIVLRSISAGNRREQSKIKNYEYLRILIAFTTFDRSRLLPALIE